MDETLYRQDFAYWKIEKRDVPNGAIKLDKTRFVPGIKPDLEGIPHGIFIIKYFIVKNKFGILSPSLKKILQSSISLSPKNRRWKKEDAPSMLCYRTLLLKDLYKLIPNLFLLSV